MGHWQRGSPLATLPEFLATSPEPGESLHAFIDAMEAVYSPDIFSRAIYFLAHISLPSDEAREHWLGILRHQQRMRELGEQDISIFATVADYFTRLHPRLQSPVAIEAHILEQCERLAHIDDLTGLYNRRAFNLELEREIERSRRAGTPFSLLMVDIDHFKRVNDHFGHQTGDLVLQTIAATLTRTARGMDRAARYGGEEFAIILPGTGPDNVYAVGERFRTAVERTNFSLLVPDLSIVTISIGAAGFPACGTSPRSIIAAADRALYRAKRSGRNRVSTRAEDMRAHERHFLALDLLCSDQSNGHPQLYARTRDISEGGMACVTNDSAISPGTPLRVSIIDKALPFEPTLRATAVWNTTNERSGQTHLIGMQLRDNPPGVMNCYTSYLHTLLRQTNATA
ncbi:diguanylate cyclase [Desulfobaculum sp. SPO524]|uniref:diguanylate cyclase n=1 Tax=Desulfobaculum sp. SPO524 TaxID=3378071 RepID=UPI003853D69D